MARQKNTSAGCIDLLGKDSRGNFVVVEVKSDEAGDSAIGQILGYMMALHLEFQFSLESMLGVIYCKRASNRLKYATKLVPNLKIIEFGDLRISIAKTCQLMCVTKEEMKIIRKHRKNSQN